MFRKTLTAAVAALTLAGASLTTTSSAQAGGLGKFVAAGIVGAVVGSALASRPSYQPSYSYGGGYGGGYGHRPAYRPVYGCGTRLRPIFDEYGNRAGMQRVSAC